MKSLKKLFLATSISFAFGGVAFAANVPAGVTLAEKQDINLQITGELGSIDPQLIEGTDEGFIARQIFEGLIETDDDGKPVPGVAERWESSEDSKTWTFHLRQNAKWTDGSPVTAHDFVYAWQRLVDPKTASPYASYLEFLKVENVSDVIHGKKSPDTLGVKALDNYTFQITLSESVPYAVEITQNAALYPVPKAMVEKYGDKWLRPEHFVGNGAYVIADRTLNEKIVLKRSPTYWNDKATVINNANVLILNMQSGISRYRTGDLDIGFVPMNTYKDPKFKKEYGNQILNSKKLATNAYLMNTTKPPFDDIRVRKALDLAMEREIITHKVLNHGQIPTFNFTPNYIHGGEKIQQPEYANWTQAQRNEEAIKLLAEAGYTKANPLKTDLLYATNEDAKIVSVAIASIWKKNTNGAVDIGLQNKEWKTFLETKSRKDYTLIFFGWGADYNEASSFLTVFLSNNPQNDSGFKSEKFDQLIHQSYLAKTEAERAEIYNQAEAELDRHHPFVAIYNATSLAVKNPKLKGFSGNNPMGGYAIKDLYFEK